MRKECRQYIALIVDSVEGRLSSVDAERLSAHLHSCGECAMESVKMKAAVVQLSSLRDNVMPDPFMETRITARIHENASRPGFMRQIAISIAGLALLITGFFAGIYPSITGSRADIRYVNHYAIEKFVFYAGDEISRYALQPTDSNRVALADSFYDYLEDQYGMVDEKSFNATYAYLESNIHDLI